MSTWSIAQANLTSVGVLGFIFGFFASRVKSDVRVPDAIYQFLSIYLLFGIGLKGGHSLKASSFSELVTPAIATTLMEIPGLIVGIFLASRSVSTKVGWAATFKEVLLGKTVLLLAGGLFIGFVTSHDGYQKVSPFFVELLNGFLVLFLLHLGFLAGSNFFEIKNVGAPLAVFGLLFPILSGSIGVVAGSLIGLSVGGATMLGVLCASASYIAAPAAVSVALKQANLPIALMSSIGITFPFNLIFGIPIYYKFAQVLTNLV